MLQKKRLSLLKRKSETDSVVMILQISYSACKRSLSVTLYLEAVSTNLGINSKFNFKDSRVTSKLDTELIRISVFTGKPMAATQVHPVTFVTKSNSVRPFLEWQSETFNFDPLSLNQFSKGFCIVLFVFPFQKYGSTLHTPFTLFQFWVPQFSDFGLNLLVKS